MTQVLVLTLSGDDQPGVTAGLTHVLANQPVSIRPRSFSYTLTFLIVPVMLITFFICFSFFS